MSLLSNTAIKKILSETQTWTASQNYQDDAKLLFGESAGDLEVYHDGTNSYIKEDGTGDLIFLVDNKIIFKDDDDGDESLWEFDTGGRTFTIGATDGNDDVATSFYGDVTVSDNTDFNGIVRLSENGTAVDNFLAIGSADDLRIYHASGADTWIRNFSGNLVIRNEGDDTDIIFQNDDNSGGVTDWIALDGGEYKTLFKVDTRHQDNVKAYFGSDNDVEIYFDGALRFDLDQVSQVPLNMDVGDFNIDTHGRFYIRDADDGDAVLFDFDTGSRTLTIGKDNDGIDVSIYGDVAGEYTTLYRNYDYTAGNKTTLKLMTADQSAYIVGHRTSADAGSDLQFDVTDSTGARQLGMLITEASDIKFQSGTYIGTDTGNNDHIRLLSNSTLFNRKTEHQDDIYAHFGNSEDSNIRWNQSDSLMEFKSDSHFRFKVDKGNSGTGWFYVNDGADTTMFAISETETSFPESYGIRYAYNVSSNYDFTTAVTDSGITISTASNTRDMIFNLGSSATQILRLADTLLTVGSTDNQIPLGIARYENSGTYDDYGVIRPTFSTGGIAIDTHNGSGYVKTLEVTKSQQVRLAIDGSSSAGYLSVGADQDLKIYHNATDSVIQNNTGDLYITNNVTDKDVIIRTDGLTEYMRFDGSAGRITINKRFDSNTAHSGTLDTFSGDIGAKTHTQTATLHNTTDFLGGAYSSLSLIEKLALKSLMYRINIGNHTVNYTNIDAGGGLSTWDITIQYQYSINGGSSYTDVGTTTHRISDSGGSFTTDFSSLNAYPRGDSITGDVLARIRVTMSEVTSLATPSIVTAYTGTESVTSTLTTRTSFN